MMSEMEEGTWSLTMSASMRLNSCLKIYRPDIYCAGIKEKYAIQKSGIPMKQLHSTTPAALMPGSKVPSILSGDRSDGEQQSLGIYEGALAGASGRSATYVWE